MYENHDVSQATVDSATLRMTTVELNPDPPVEAFARAKDLADAESDARFGDHMLLSWYDHDRDLESPQHTSECHRDSAVPGYVDYAVYRGASLKIDVDGGRFVFFYLPVRT